MQWVFQVRGNCKNPPEVATLRRMKITITGTNGQLGKTLLSQTKNHVIQEIKRPEVDIRHAESVKRSLESFRPEVIIHAAALTNVEHCEDHQKEAVDINVRGTENILQAAGDAHVVYLSTEYVFDGKKGPYSEEDKPNPQSVYAQTKYEGEQIVLSRKNSSVIRTTVVYTYEQGSKNFLMQLLSGKLNRFPSDQISNPTLTENLAEATLEIATRKLAGIYNIVGEDRIDRYQFALSIASKFNLDTSTWRPVSTAELGQKAPRPLDCGLEIDKAKRELQTPLLTLEKALQFVYEKSQIQ